jgi:hypothetical protein
MWRSHFLHPRAAYQKVPTLMPQNKSKIVYAQHVRVVSLLYIGIIPENGVSANIHIQLLGFPSAVPAGPTSRELSPGQVPTIQKMTHVGGEIRHIAKQQ